jgi:hypothetical protein
MNECHAIVKRKKIKKESPAVLPSPPTNPNQVVSSAAFFYPLPSRRAAKKAGPQEVPEHPLYACPIPKRKKCLLVASKYRANLTAEGGGEVV